MFTVTQMIIVVLFVVIAYLAGLLFGNRSLINKAYHYKRHAEFMTMLADTALNELSENSSMDHDQLSDLISEKMKARIELL